VTSGSRVTLVYSLSRSERPRTDATRDQKLASLRAAAGALQLDTDTPLLVACTRQIITDGKQPQSIDTLRGTDREIADAFADAGFDVAVRACLVGDDREGEAPRFPDPAHVWGITRLTTALPDAVVAGMDEIVSFTDTIEDDEESHEEDMNASLLGKYVLDVVETSQWVIRKRAAATAIYEGMYSETGYFGNEASLGHIYTLAAIEVTRATPEAKR
jgi:hypothetical protein